MTLLCYFQQQNGIKGSCHFDLLGEPQIGMEIIGVDGTIIWDRINPSIQILVFQLKNGGRNFETDDMVSSYTHTQAFINNIKNGEELKMILIAELKL